MLERNRLLVELEGRRRQADRLPKSRADAARVEAQTHFNRTLARLYSDLDICIWKADSHKQSK